MSHLIFRIILMLGVNNVLTIPDWSTTLTRHITQTVSPFQIIFLISNETRSQPSQNVVWIDKIEKVIPTWKLSFKNQSISDIGSLSFLNSLKAPRETTLFIIVDFPRDDYDLEELRIPIEFIIGISPIRIRPKCLMVLSTKNNLGYKKLLRFMWSKKFLDATVLEIKEHVEETMLLKNRKHDTDSRSVITKLHYYNPFTQNFTERKYCSETRLFPEKLNDLHGYEMKVALYDSPPYSYVKRNSTGHPIEAHGSDVRISRVLADKMRFKMFLTPSKSGNWGRMDCNKDKATEGFYSVSHSEIQLISNVFGTNNICNEQFSEETITYDYITFNALVPILPSTTVSYLDPLKCAFPIILISLITFTVHIFAWKLKFNAASRQWHYILQPLLGAAAVETPWKLKERIVFGCLLITGMTYVSFIFSSLTEAIGQVESKMKMEDMHDLYESGFIPVINEVIYKNMFNDTEGIDRKILEKSFRSPFSDQDCFKMLEEHKNVSCFMRLSTAQSILANSCKDIFAQILKQPLATRQGAMKMEPASPYVDRFNEIILLVVQSGLYEKWKSDYSVNVTFKIDSDHSAGRKMNSQIIFFQIFIYVITGYTLSILAFLAELIHGHSISLMRILKKK